MEEKFIATLYEKIELSENIFLFKRENIIKEGYINLLDDMEELKYYDESNRRVILEYMENPYVIVSDDKYCYGYPITKDELEEMYPNLTEKEMLEKYRKEISEVINIAYYNELEDTVKLLVTNEEQLKQVDSDELFSDFCIEYDSSYEHTVSLPKNDIKKAINMIEKQQYEKLKENLLLLGENIKQSDEGIGKLFGINTESEEEQIEVTDDKNVEETLNKLYDLVGLDNIKKEIEKLLSYLSFRNKSEKYLNLEKPNLHMFFTGNPGTGKTTVARIIGELLYKLGYVTNNKVAEITPKDLIGEYVGQTGPKTANFIKKHKGGVIFIDEAYVFSSKAQEFAEEALVEILKELEKKETVFIFAGYRDEMKHFMEMNPGLTSRVGYYLDYNDYTTDELYQIFETKIINMGFIIEDSLKAKVLANLKEAKDNKNFGNGRYVDKLINKIILDHSINTEKYKRKDKLITLKDIDFTQETQESLIFKTKTKQMGFKI